MTVPWSDPAFAHANEAALRVAEHLGHLDYLAAPETKPGDGLPHPSPGLVSGAATYVSPAPPSLAEGSAASPPAEPGRCSVIEIFNESERIRLLIEARRARTEGSQ